MPKIYGYTEILGDILITGSFSVLGSASTINTTNLVVSDTIISLGHSQSGLPIFDEGLMFGRGTGLTQAFIWDESDDTFALIGTNDDHTIIGDINIDSYSNLRVGGLTTSTIKITSGAVNGYYLQTDGSGNTTWAPAGTIYAAGAGGTTNYIPYWTNSNTLSSTSSIYFDNTFVGIGGTTSISTVGGFKPKLQITDGLSGITNTMPITSTPLLVQSNSTTSIGLFSPDINTSQIYFGTPADEFGSFLRWDYTNRNLILSTANTSGKIILQTGNSVEAARIDQNGNVGIGTTSPSYKLEVSGTVSTTAFRMTNGSNTGYYLRSDSSGNASWTQLPGGLTGSGTTNYVSKWSGSGTLTDSKIYDNGTVLGINGWSSQNTFTIQSNSEVVALSVSNTNTSTSTKRGVYTNLSGGVNQYGYTSEVLGSADRNYGVDISVSGASLFNYGIQSQVSGTATSNYGIYNTVLGGLSNTYGIYTNITSGTYGAYYGNYVNISTGVGNTTWGVADNYGSYVRNLGSASTNTGIYSQINNGDFANNGLWVVVGNSPMYTSGDKAINAQITNTSTNISDVTCVGYFINQSKSTNGNYGIQSVVSGTYGTNYGIFVDSSGAVTNYGVYVTRGTSVFNELGDTDTDFRIEGDTDQNLFFVDASNNNIGIGTNSPNTSSILQLSSTTKGFLPPKMTANQAESISSPAEGLIVYSTDGSGVTITSKGWWGYTGATWTQFA